MMERTVSGSRYNCVIQAWPNQAMGAALPNEPPQKSQAKISILPTSLQVTARTAIPRSIASAHHSRLHRILAREPAHNQYP